MHRWSSGRFHPEEVSAILGRPPRDLDLRPARRFLRESTVLVTGAGGSIGSALCVQLAQIGCPRIIALDNSDHALIDVVSAVKAKHPSQTLVDVLCDIRDPERLTACMTRTAPDLVIHAAALKHIHMGERHPAESVLTNLVGVRNAFDAALAARAGGFVLVSSDKAAAPGSVMGATKRLAELYISTVARELRAAGREVNAISVRFGNVFGSKGSVAPMFARQIAAGENLTITHPDMTRFFMTLEEAVQLILLAAAAPRLQSGSTSLLDMGEPVRVVDIARRMMDVAGVDLPLRVIGLREGEKLSERLFDEFERVETTPVDGVFRLDSLSPDANFGRREVDDVERLVRHVSDEVIRHRLFGLLDQRFPGAVSATG